MNPDGTKLAEMRYDACPTGVLREGNTRYTQGVTPTDYQYTGQRNEAGIGLYYYNARWVDVSLGRFVQADTIVPGGVQGFDRYAYVNNSPTMYTDPSGLSSDCSGIPSNYARQQCERSNSNEELYAAFQNGLNTGNWGQFDGLLGITLTTDGTATWDTITSNGVTFNEAIAVRQAAMDVAFGLGSLNSSLSAVDAFQLAYGTSEATLLEFKKVSVFYYDSDGDRVDEEYKGGGLTVDGYHIILANLSDSYFESARNTVVHELGHAFDKKHDGTMPQDYITNRSEILQTSPNPFMKQLNKKPNSSETFADFFVAYIYGYWKTTDIGSNARTWMTTNMAEWMR